MIKFIEIEAGFAILKWDNIDDSYELKKFLDGCEVTLHYHKLAPSVPGGDCNIGCDVDE